MTRRFTCVFAVVTVALATAAAVACGPVQTGPTGSSPRPASAAGTAQTSTAPSPAASARSGDDRIAAILDGAAPGRWPSTTSEVNRMLTAFPSTLGTLRVTARTRAEVVYAGPGSASATLTIMSLGEAAGPNTKMGTFFEALASNGQFQVILRQPLDSKVLYLVGTTTDGPVQPAAAWAAPDGHWLYGAEATDEATLLAMVSSFEMLTR